MSNNYSYPIDDSWTKDELIQVIEFLELVEQAYESSVSLEKFKDNYKQFKMIVTSKSQEKQLDKKFQNASGYSIYAVVQKMKQLEQNNSKEKIKMH